MLARLILALLAADPEWKHESTTDGITLESRPVKDSAFYEYRASADTRASVAALCDAIFEWGSVGTDHEGLKSRKLLEDRGDTRVVYDQFDPPVVSRRDLAFTITRHHNDDGSCRIDYVSSPDKAPKLADGWVRIEKLKGGWTFTPLPGGGAHVVYMLFADSGGSIPAAFVHGSQRDASVKTVRNGIQAALKARAAESAPPAR